MSEDLFPLDPREARDEYVDHRRVDRTDETVQSYHYRLKHFIEWCEEEGIESLHELSGRDLKRFDQKRRADGLQPTTLKAELSTLRNFLRYCAKIEGVPPQLPEKVMVPTPHKDEEVSDEKLSTEQAMALLEYYREEAYGTRQHALLEFIWNTGARISSVCAIDLEDYHPDEAYVEIRHRPGTGTGLKNKRDGERPISLSSRVRDAIDAYIRNYRHSQRDDHGRRPLFTSARGRPKKNTIRQWTYDLTRPCVFGPCPHDRDPDECDAMEPNRSSLCPSSRSPHPIRTGSISWQLDCGIPMEVVEARVNASREVILRHYDKRAATSKMEQRREHVIPKLDY